MPHYINPPPQSPLARIVAAIIAVFALIGSFMIGLAALLVVAGVALVAGIALWLRIAWIKRRLKKNGMNLGAESESSRNSGQVIDAEYTVVSESDTEKD
jgi:ABC-type glucose/galactose transport system permease subunit